MFDIGKETFTNFRDNYWNPPTLFWAIFIFSWIVFIWDTYIGWRQFRIVLNTTKLPVELSGIMDRETFLNARAYSIDRTKFTLFYHAWSQTFSSVILLCDLMPLLWDVSATLMEPFGLDKSYEITRTLVFVNVGALISKVIDLPWSYYSNFVIQEKHGFNRQTRSFFAKDQVKKFFVSQAITCIILPAIIWIIQKGDDYFFLYLWGFCSLIVFLMMTIYPDFIAPLFDKYVPLPEGSLREKITTMAQGLKFPLTQVYIVEGSKRSSHSNAYLYGFYKNKRIVLFDTLMENPPKMSDSGDESSLDKDNASDGEKSNQQDAAVIAGETSDVTAAENEALTEETDKDTKEKKKKGCNDDEILAVLGHELGHWKLNHVVINLIIAEVQMLFTFMIFGFLYKDPVIYQAFGFNDQPILIGLLVITQYIFAPYNEIVGFLMTCLTRHHEFGADNFAKKMNRASDLRSALIKLGNDNLEFPVYDWLYSATNLSHPPLLERLKALGKID
ncbi:CAAX prenyl protease 1 homolog [Tetranychus urticae]|uniref:CAAX prenyl protease n=1 Tax=Tetranychus urticae TaxID=32264 RepID=T1L1R5_TETUR|nr:CAAX prenyl protease 1 homolog [Tetranychus urticae]